MTRVWSSAAASLSVSVSMASVEFICLPYYYEILNFAVLRVQIWYVKLPYVHGSSDSILVWSVRVFCKFIVKKINEYWLGTDTLLNY